MKVLCFTTSYNRPKFLRSCIQDIRGQSYSNIHHVINIAYDKKIDYGCIFDDISNSTIVYNKNNHQHINHLNAINAVEYEKFDLFIKIDDDDIYKSRYVENIVNYFINNNIDICTSYIKNQLNGYFIKTGIYNNLGANPENSDYHMPMTIAFNRKGLEKILEIKNPSYSYYEDNLWRNKWSADGLIHGTVDNNDQVIWNIHGKNISTFNFLIKPE